MQCRMTSNRSLRDETVELDLLFDYLGRMCNVNVHVCVHHQQQHAMNKYESMIKTNLDSFYTILA